MKISIIIPIFEAEQYLKICLDSILCQTFQNFEIIAVNDGSTDNSAKILQQYQKKDSRIIVLNKENGGVSSARNLGLDHAKGDYICFVDSDDFVTPTYLEDLLLALMNGADSSMCGFQHFPILEGKPIVVVPDKKKIENLEENLLEFYDIEKKDWQRYMWNRLFSAEIIHKLHLRFREDIYYKEDGLFVVQFLCGSNGLVGCIDKVDYLYRQNENSAMGSLNKYFNKKLITNIHAHRLIIKELKKANVSDYIIKIAIKQIKFTFYWIQDILKNTKHNNLKNNLALEKEMLLSLGYNNYCIWKIRLHFSRIFTIK